MTKVQQIFLKRHINSGTPTENDFEKKVIEFDVESTQLSENQIIVSLQVVSPDPYMRGRMSGKKSYIPPYSLDSPIAGFAVGKVLKSNNSKWVVGDFVAGIFPWQEIFVHDGQDKLLNKVDPNLAPLSSYISILGMPGLTAFHGMNEIGEPKEGETLVVSGGAGAVGQYVGQIGKIKGCKVIGIAGSDDKVDYMVKELGFDQGINYNSPTYKDDIAKATNGKVDIYWENVGGAVSDAVFPHLNFFARIPLCGVISQYNNETQDLGPRIQGYLLKTSSKMQGFIVSNYAAKNGPAFKQLAEWYKTGQIKDRHTVNHGFDQLVPSFLSLFKGSNTGKMIVELN